MDRTHDDRIFTPNFRALCLGIVLGPVFLLGATLLIMAWVEAANYDGVGDSSVYDLLIWGFWLAVVGLAGLVPVGISRAGAWRRHTNAVQAAS